MFESAIFDEQKNYTKKSKNLLTLCLFSIIIEVAYE